MKKVLSGILVLALILTTVASLSARPNDTARSYQVSSGELSYVIGGRLIGCLVGIAGAVGALGCAGSAATPVTFWYGAACVSAGLAAGLTIGSECF